VTDTEVEVAKRWGVSEREYIEQKVKITLDQELKENT
jgi:hypothetical protein